MYGEVTAANAFSSLVARRNVSAVEVPANTLTATYSASTGSRGGLRARKNCPWLP